MFYSLQQAADVVGVNKVPSYAPSKRVRFPPPATSAINGSSSQPSFVGFIHRPLRTTAKSNAMAPRTSANSLKPTGASP